MTENHKKTRPLIFISRHRKWIAFGFFAFIAFVAIRHQIIGGGPDGSASVCSYCPMGAIASLYQFMTDGTFLHRIHQSSLVLLTAVVILTIFSRRGFCGWICPFGTLQEWIAWTGRKLFRRTIELPEKIDGLLRYLKYVVLLGVVAASWYYGSLIFRDYDPYLAFFHFGLGMDELPIAYMVLGGTIIGSLVIERFWCRYLCPLGAALAVVGKLGFMTITHERSTCVNCKIGEKNCPVGIDPNAETEIRSLECIQCMECVSACPVHHAIHVEIMGRRLRPAAIGISIAASFLIVIGVAQFAGYWQTKGSRAQMETDIQQLGAEAIRGWMTLEDVRGMYGMDEQAFRSLLGLPEHIAMSTQLRELENAEDANLPNPEDIREILSGLQPVQAGTVTSSGIGSGAGGGTGRSNDTERTEGGSRPFIRGNTTLGEALQSSGKSLAEFQKDWKSTASSETTMRDLAEQLDVEMWDLREYFGQKR